MEIVQIISEHKRKLKAKPVKKDNKRVMVTVREFGFIQTRHIDIPK